MTQRFKIGSKEFRSRLANFTDAYPKFKSLRKFEVPLDLPPKSRDSTYYLILLLKLFPPD